MIETALSFICEHADQAHWMIFLLFLLAGLNIPISEDLLLIGGGAIASSCIPEHTLRLYIWILMGCYISSWETYWIGRLLGPKLYRFRLFSHILTPKRLNRLRYYYAKLGILTFIVGRFCPGGVRNALMLSSGLTKMPFHLYVFRDGLAALISTTILFHIGYTLGANTELIHHYLHLYSEWILGVLILVILLVGTYFYYRHKKSQEVL